MKHTRQLKNFRSHYCPTKFQGSRDWKNIVEFAHDCDWGLQLFQIQLGVTTHKLGKENNILKNNVLNYLLPTSNAFKKKKKKKFIKRLIILFLNWIKLCPIQLNSNIYHIFLKERKITYMGITLHSSFSYKNDKF